MTARTWLDISDPCSSRLVPLMQMRLLSSLDHTNQEAAHIMPADANYMSIKCHAELTSAHGINNTHLYLPL